ETRTWLDQHRAHFDVVDPEIGHMALAATTANVPFDYLHIVTDNLNGAHDHGLYDERSTPVATRRRRCLHHIETILHRSLACTRPHPSPFSARPGATPTPSAC